MHNSKDWDMYRSYWKTFYPTLMGLWFAIAFSLLSHPFESDAPSWLGVDITLPGLSTVLELTYLFGFFAWFHVLGVELRKAFLNVPKPKTVKKALRAGTASFVICFAVLVLVSPQT